MAKRNILTQGKKQKADQAARMGSLEEARALFSSVCKTDGSDVEAWVKLSLLDKRLGNPAAAEASARRAVALAPQQALAQYALGAALHSQAKLAEAAAAYRNAVRLQPQLADAHYWLGNCLHQQGQVAEALNCYRQALQLKPEFPEALGDLGAALLDQGELAQGMDLLQRGQRLQPGNAVIAANLANGLRLQGKVVQAIDQYRHALRLAPAATDIQAGLANLLEKTGALEEARALTLGGLQQTPDNADLHLVMAQLERRAKQLQAAAERLEALCRQPLRNDQSGDAELLLGQLYDEMNLPEQAYPLIASGKRKKAGAALIDGKRQQEYLRYVASMRQLASATLRQAAEPPAAADTPVFLVGFPRSGTTLLEQILDSHPALQTMEEQGAADVMLQVFLNQTAGTPQALQSLDDSQLAGLRQAYQAEVTSHLQRQPGTTLIDKLPLNIVLVPLLWRVFPQAKFILALRHPCDVCLSCLMQNFAVNNAMASFFDLEDTVEAYVAVMEAWQHYSAQLPLQFHPLRYEDLVTDTAGETRRLLDFLGVEWNDAVLAHTEHARQRGAINTPSYHQVVQPVYQSARFRWQRYQRVFEPLLPKLQPLIEQFGY